MSGAAFEPGLNFEIKIGGSRARLGATAPFIYAIIPYKLL